MRLRIIFLGKTKKQYIVDGIDDFIKRLKRYVRVEIQVVKEKRGKGGKGQDTLQKQEEGRQLLEWAGKKAYKVGLDPTGKEYSSMTFAGQLTRWEQQNRQDIVFLIGGPLGLSEEVKSEADMLLSLSKMTFTHDMTRMLLVEQLYRAFSIKAGSKYHK